MYDFLVLSRKRSASRVFEYRPSSRWRTRSATSASKKSRAARGWIPILLAQRLPIERLSRERREDAEPTALSSVFDLGVSHSQPYNRVVIELCVIWITCVRAPGHTYVLHIRITGALEKSGP